MTCVLHVYCVSVPVCVYACVWEETIRGVASLLAGLYPASAPLTATSCWTASTSRSSRSFSLDSALLMLFVVCSVRAWVPGGVCDCCVF